MSNTTALSCLQRTVWFSLVCVAVQWVMRKVESSCTGGTHTPAAGAESSLSVLEEKPLMWALILTGGITAPSQVSSVL